MNTIGRIFRVTTFGESHGPAVGGVIDGMPAGIEINLDRVQQELNRRRPGQSAIVTPRDEKDQVKILSGMFEGKTTGCPIGFIVENSNQHSSDYENIRNTFRPSHADFTYTSKYGDVVTFTITNMIKNINNVLIGFLNIPSLILSSNFIKITPQMRCQEEQ